MTATVCMLFRPRDGAIEAALTMEVDATSDGDAMATVEVAVAMKVAVAMEVVAAMDIFNTREQPLHVQGVQWCPRRIHSAGRVGAFAVAVNGIVGRRGNHDGGGEDSVECWQEERDDQLV